MHDRSEARRVPHLILVLLMALTLISATASPAAAQDEVPEDGAPAEDEQSDANFITIAGRGWGHGRGMGQYGAQGYATNFGWTSAQILDHFYGGTTAGTAPATLSHPEPRNTTFDANALRVDIRSLQGLALRVRVDEGSVALTADGVTLPQPPPEASAVRLTTVDSDTIRLEFGVLCFGNEWVETHEVDVAEVRVTPVSTAQGLAGKLRVCHGIDGSSTFFDGDVSLVNVGGQERTINHVSVEQYLRGVVPQEVPASWDEDALQAQAVAARSYVLAGDVRDSWADTCDTARCQVYGGLARQASLDAEIVPSTHLRTDMAIEATAGVVRIRDDNGEVARTEFSSSTGGHTTAFDFPAVEDLGDAIASNPNHRWTERLDLTNWVAAQNQGALIEVVVTKRDGFGEGGGRAVAVEARMENGTVIFTGDEFRRAFGLRSTYFFIGELEFATQPGDRNYVDALYQLFLGRAPSDAERNASLATLIGGGRSALTNELALSTEWAGTRIDALYENILRRENDAEGRAYWMEQLSDGLRLEAIAASFFGSTEYYLRAGGTDEAFVADLYEDLLGRSADADGAAFWVATLGEGASPVQISSAFYASTESRTDRVRALYREVLDREPDADGLTFWTATLLDVDDVRLAAELAGSDEFYNRAQQ